MTPCQQIKDVQRNYWAAPAISDVVTHNVMTLDENGNFNPENSLTRVEFVQAILKILSDDNLDIKIQNTFSDVNPRYPAYSDILRSEQLGLIYGYPDGTFKPENTLLKSEVTSIMSHITRETVCDTSILRHFLDYQDIPNWATHAYAKTTKYGLYVNYPNERIFSPNRDLTRAEAAVLLCKLRLQLGLVKDEFKGNPNEVVTSVEHLNVSKKAPVNIVKVTNMRKIILQNNLLAVSFESKFSSKKAHTGDVITFVIPQNLYTKEGTLVLPANTRLCAEVIGIQNPKWFNKNARVDLQFRSIVLPDGRVFPLAAKPFTKDRMLKEGPWMTTGKLVLSTVSFGILGGGAGAGFGFIPTPTKIGTGLAIGIPVGCTVGLITGLVTKGLQYKAKAGEQIFIILDTDTSVYN
jgi:hypothetical protein